MLLAFINFLSTACLISLPGRNEVAIPYTRQEKQTTPEKIGSNITNIQGKHEIKQEISDFNLMDCTK